MKYLNLFLVVAMLATACSNNSDSQEKAETAKKDSLTTGKFPKGEKFFYETGELHMNGKVKDGMRNGPWVSWFKNGIQNSEAYFINDEMDGEYKVWYENGAERIVGMYKKDVEVGTWYFFADNGDTLKVIDYSVKPYKVLFSKEEQKPEAGAKK